MEITVYECKTAVAVVLPDACVVFNRKGSWRDPPVEFGPGYQPMMHTTCTLAKGRWEKMPRREAQPWVRRAQDYHKSLGAAA